MAVYLEICFGQNPKLLFFESQTTLLHHKLLQKVSLVSKGICYVLAECYLAKGKVTKFTLRRGAFQHTFYCTHKNTTQHRKNSAINLFFFQKEEVNQKIT